MKESKIMKYRIYSARGGRNRGYPKKACAGGTHGLFGRDEWGGGFPEGPESAKESL